MNRRSLLAGLFAAPVVPALALATPAAEAVEEAPKGDGSVRVHINTGAGRYSRADIEEIMRGIDARLADGYRLRVL